MNLTARFTKKDLLSLTEISVLASNASANSYHPSGSNTDGPASWAFDDNEQDGGIQTGLEIILTRIIRDRQVKAILFIFR